MIIDANMYWFDEDLFTDKVFSDRFLSEIENTDDMFGYLKEEAGKSQYVIEKPRGFQSLNYIQGEYQLADQLADMDEAGVDMSVLKLSCQQEWLSLEMCKCFNDRMHHHVADSNGRMIGLGVVPAVSDEMTYAEIDRCFDELHFHGIQLSTHYNGRYLDHEDFAGLFAYLNYRRATVYVHHSPIPADYEHIKEFNNLRRSYGRNVDQCTAVGRELFSDFFIRYPDVRMVHSMLGGGIFAYLGLLLPEKSAENAGRFDDDSELRRSFLRNNLYFEMSHAEPWGKQQLECAIKALGSKHVIFGSSYPVKKKWLLNGPDFVRQLDISNEDKENVLYKNAMKLYME